MTNRTINFPNVFNARINSAINAAAEAHAKRTLDRAWRLMGKLPGSREANDAKELLMDRAKEAAAAELGGILLNRVDALILAEARKFAEELEAKLKEH